MSTKRRSSCPSAPRASGYGSSCTGSSSSTANGKSPHPTPSPSLLPTPPILRPCASVSWPVNRSPPSLVSRARAYASASALQVVLWRVRYFMMLPRAVRAWAMLFAYAALLSAVYLGQSVTRRPG